jgi:hypothetical protein
MSSVWDPDSEFTHLFIGILLASLLEKLVILLIVNIANTLKEEQREDILLITSGINLAAQTNCCTPKE